MRDERKMGRFTLSSATNSCGDKRDKFVQMEFNLEAEGLAEENDRLTVSAGRVISDSSPSLSRTMESTSVSFLVVVKSRAILRNS